MKKNHFCFIISMIILLFSFELRAESGIFSKARRVEEKTLSFKKNGCIFIEGREGKISIQSWNREEVRIVMTKIAWGRTRRRAEDNLEEIKVDIEKIGNRLYIRDVTEDIFYEDFNFFDIFRPDSWKYRRKKVDFELIVPENVELDIRNNEGKVDISEINGKISLEVDEGNVELFNISSSDLYVIADEGDVFIIDFNKDIDTLRGRINIHTDEGKIRLKNCKARNLNLDSDEGDLIIYNATVKKMSVFTDEGDIETDVNVVENGNYRIRTDEGDVVVVLSKDPDIRIDAETFEGKIRSDFRLHIREENDGEKAKGIIGRGSAVLVVRTSEGHITLEEKF